MKRAASVVVVLLVIAQSHAGEVCLQAWNYAMPAEREFYDGLIADFEQAHPGDRVRFEFGEWDDAHEKIGEWLKTHGRAGYFGPSKATRNAG